MSFFQGASNVTINGGEFNNIKGNYTVFNNSRHETNFGSKNMRSTTMKDSFNDNSFRGQNPPSRPARAYRDDDQMDWTPPDDRRRDYPGSPPPQQPPFMPPQAFPGGGNVSNADSFNTNNTHVNDAFNDNSRTYQYGHPPPNQQRRGQPQKRSMYEEETFPDVVDDYDLQSNRGSPPSSAQKPFQAKSWQKVGAGARSGPSIMVDSPHIQHMDEEMRETFAKLMKQTKSTVERNGVPNVPVPVPENNDDEIYVSDDGGSSSSHSIQPQDRMNDQMADLSIHDSFSGPAHLSPPQLASRNKSDPQIPSIIPEDNVMTSSNPPKSSPYNTLQQSHSTPSVPPHMQEPAMKDFLAQTNPTQQDQVRGNNDPNNRPPLSTSGFHSPSSSSGGQDIWTNALLINQPNTSEAQNDSLENSPGKRNKDAKKKGLLRKWIK